MNAVEVCNLALGRAGEGASRPIQSLTENSEAARACNRVFATSMETTLRDFPWAFAQASVALAPIVQTVPGWEHVYAYPENCVFLHGLADADCDPGRMPVWRTPYRILAATNGESRVIATDLPEAWAHFTLNITNPHFGDPSYQNAVAWLITAEVALGLKADPRMATNATQQYQAAISHAAATSRREQVADREADPEDVRAYGASLEVWPWNGAS